MYCGKLSDEEINKRRHRLQKLRLEAERKHFPDGLESDQKRFSEAEGEAVEYFRVEYGV